MNIWQPTYQSALISRVLKKNLSNSHAACINRKASGGRRKLLKPLEAVVWPEAAQEKYILGHSVGYWTLVYMESAISGILLNKKNPK